MGAIRSLTNGEVRQLETEHVVGRARRCALCLSEHKFVSAQHASLRFSGERWELRDLGSSNGTYLDGVRVVPGEARPLAPGAKLAFGSRQQEWELVDDGPPRVMAVPLDGGAPTLCDGELLTLPSPEQPSAAIYRGSDGGWLLEQPDELAPISNAQVFEVEGKPYRFCCPDLCVRTSLAETNSSSSASRIELKFLVSGDEQSVQLSARCGSRVIDLGDRSHHYLLLTLARQRVADAADGIPDPDCGWVYHEDFEHDPAMAAPQLNVDVFRARRQFDSAGIPDAARLIERRPRTKQLRLGVRRISIVQELPARAASASLVVSGKS
ncbi:MAG TPA: FHA domain-containing protein [Polyangiaceae bacterium]|jgi:hypothetical protein|nr:FHA domain-containing protein [Polyangiaceae bacterium]